MQVQALRRQPRAFAPSLPHAVRWPCLYQPMTARAPLSQLIAHR